jgi:DNA modification methylase
MHLKERVKEIVKERLEWGPLATFIPNKKEPVYNWFYYKEGFSSELVLKLAEKFGLKHGDTVLDPFCGVGTTLLACKQLGINSVGFDVHPVAVFAAKVKTRDYDPEKIKEAVKSLLKIKFQQPDIGTRNPLVKRAFNRHSLEDVVFFRNEIMAMDDAKIRDFCILALMNVAMRCSYAWKDGAVIKIKKHPVPPLRKLLKRQLYRMTKDVSKCKKTDAKCEADFGDARRMDLENGTIDAVITSPPYLNKIEYTRVYSIEEELFFQKQAKPGLRSYIGLENEKMLQAEEKLKNIIDVAALPLSAVAYFSDMYEVVKELYRVCKTGAKLGIVVGNGCFPAGVVDSDVILSEIAENAGFEANEVLVLNKRWCTKNRVEKVGIARESLIIWERC